MPLVFLDHATDFLVVTNLDALPFFQFDFTFWTILECDSRKGLRKKD